MTCDLLVSKSDLCLQPLMWRDCEKCPVKIGPMDEISHDEREISQGEQKKMTDEKKRRQGETRHPGEGGVPYSKSASGTENGYLGIAHSSEAEAEQREERLNVCEDLWSIRRQRRSIKLSPAIPTL